MIINNRHLPYKKLFYIFRKHKVFQSINAFRVKVVTVSFNISAVKYVQVKNKSKKYEHHFVHKIHEVYQMWLIEYWYIKILVAAIWILGSSVSCFCVSIITPPVLIKWPAAYLAIRHKPLHEIFSV